jgi:hypothetical protein
MYLDIIIYIITIIINHQLANYDDDDDVWYKKSPYTIHMLTKHCNSFSDGCITKRTSCHSNYIGSTISTQTIMTARTKQDGFLSILTDHTKISFTHQEIQQEQYVHIYLSIHMISVVGSSLTFLCCRFFLTTS